MTLESIEKLREWVEGLVLSTDGDVFTCYMTYEKHDFIKHIADEIQAEIDSRFMELPVDADGVPWSFTDECLIDEHGDKCAFTAMRVTRDGRWEVATNCVWHLASDCRHVKPRTVEDAMAEYAEISTSEDVKKYHDLSDELMKIQYEQFRDKPEHEFYKELNGYEFYIELPYDELCIGHEKAWVNHHSYSYMYKKPDGGTVYSCSSLCGYSRDWAIERIENEIGRIEREHGDAE